MIRKCLYAEIVGSVVILAAALTAGCGQSSPSDEPKTEAQLAADQKKIQELSKQGYDFAEIRAIMKGEQPKPRPKKKSGTSRH